MGRSRCYCGELRGELAKHEVLALSFDQTKGCGIPKRRCATNTKDHFVAIGESIQLTQCFAYVADNVPHGVLTMTRTEVVLTGCGKGIKAIDVDGRRPRSKPAV